MSEMTDRLDDIFSYAFEHAPKLRAHTEFGKLYRKLRALIEINEAQAAAMRSALETISYRKPVTLLDGTEWRMKVQDCAKLATEALKGGVK